MKIGGSHHPHKPAPPSMPMPFTIEDAPPSYQRTGSIKIDASSIEVVDDQTRL